MSETEETIEASEAYKLTIKNVIKPINKSIREQIKKGKVSLCCQINPDHENIIVSFFRKKGYKIYVTYKKSWFFERQVYMKFSWNNTSKFLSSLRNTNKIIKEWENSLP
jgi:hypothetical protein